MSCCASRRPGSCGGYGLGLLGARPLDEAIHQSGLWAIRLIFLALAVTPLRQVLVWPELALVRRTIGLAAFAYAILHLALYAADQAFDLGKVASEIALRIYLTIGFVALCGLAALAATSTRCGDPPDGPARWRACTAGLCDRGAGGDPLCLQSKLDLWEPTIMAGLLSWLLAYRLVARRARPGPVAVAALALGAALAVAAAEAIYFRFAYGVGVDRLIAADLSLAVGLRPAPVVLAIGLVVALGTLLRRRPAGSQPRQVLGRFRNWGATSRMKRVRLAAASSCDSGPRRKVAMTPPTPVSSISAIASATVAGEPQMKP